MKQAIKFDLEAKVAINLNHLGIYTTVLTTLREIEDTTEIFKTTPDRNWCNGLGKDHLYKLLLRKLKVKDDYFNRHLNKVKPDNPNWRDFCNDCLTLYVLDCMCNENVFHLVHPTQYRESIKHALADGTTGRLPDYIEGIATIKH